MSISQRSIPGLASMLLLLLAPNGSRVETGASSSNPASLRDALHRPYDELFRSAPGMQADSGDLTHMREQLKAVEKSCTARFKERSAILERELKSAQEELKRTTNQIDDVRRTALHCRILDLREERGQTQALIRHAVPVAFDNYRAKLDVLEKWPSTLKEIQAEMDCELHLKRKYANVKDIGFREIEKNQEKDIATGKKALEEMRQMGMLPRELEDRAVQDYVVDLTQQIVRKSDIQVPVQVKILDSPEINAFALPGGYLFIDRGLIEAADDEAQLAGVIAHEI